jgi:hypothetical protein
MESCSIKDISLQIMAKEILYEIIDQFKSSKTENNSTKTEQSKFFNQISILNNQSLTLIKNYAQHGTALCGFHCLFNSLNFIKYLKTKDSKYLSNMNNGVKFHKLHKEIIHFLIENINLAESSINSLLTYGPLERHQFKFVLQCHKEIMKKIQSDRDTEIEYLRFFYGFGIIQGMSKEEIFDLQEKLSHLKQYKGKKNLIYVVLLGITNHWSMLILNKLPNSSQINFYYLDSHNINVFNFKNEMQIEEFVEKRFKEKEFYFPHKKPTAWSKKCFSQWIKDINECMKIIYDVILTNFSLCDLFLEYNLNRIVNTYEQFVMSEYNLGSIKEIKAFFDKLIKKQGTTISDLKSKLITWMNVEYHPRTLIDDAYRVVETFKFSSKIKEYAIYSKLCMWIYFSLNMQEILKLNIKGQKVSPKEDDLIVRYYYFLEHFIKLINWKPT